MSFGFRICFISIFFPHLWVFSFTPGCPWSDWIIIQEGHFDPLEDKPTCIYGSSTTPTGPLPVSPVLTGNKFKNGSFIFSLFQNIQIGDASHPVDLSGSDFSGTVFKNVLFVNVNLQHVNFTGSHLEGAKFLKTNVSYSDFRTLRSHPKIFGQPRETIIGALAPQNTPESQRPIFDHINFNDLCYAHHSQELAKCADTKPDFSFIQAQNSQFGCFLLRAMDHVRLTHSDFANSDFHGCGGPQDPDISPDFSYSNFSNVDFTDVTFTTKFVLNHAKLGRAKFISKNQMGQLKTAHFQEDVDLSKPDLSHIILTDNLRWVFSHFKNANLRYMSFYHEGEQKNDSYQNFDFSGADLSHGNFAYAKLNFANFQGATLDDGIFFADSATNISNLPDSEGCILKDHSCALFCNTELNASHFRGTDQRFTVFAIDSQSRDFYFVKTNSSGAHFVTDFSESVWKNRTTNLKRLNFTGVNFTGADFSNAQLDNQVFDATNLENAHFEHAKLKNSHFSMSHTSGFQNQAVRMNGANFAYANLENANFDSTTTYPTENHPQNSRTIFDHSYLSGARFSNVTFQNTSFESAHFYGPIPAFFMGYNSFENVSFANAILNHTALTYAKIINTSFQGTQCLFCLFTSMNQHHHNFLNNHFENSFLQGARFEDTFTYADEKGRLTTFQNAAIVTLKDLKENPKHHVLFGNISSTEIPNPMDQIYDFGLTHETAFPFGTVICPNGDLSTHCDGKTKGKAPFSQDPLLIKWNGKIPGCEASDDFAKSC